MRRFQSPLAPVLVAVCVLVLFMSIVLRCGSSRAPSGATQSSADRLDSRSAKNSTEGPTRGHEQETNKSNSSCQEELEAHLERLSKKATRESDPEEYISVLADIHTLLSAEQPISDLLLEVVKKFLVDSKRSYLARGLLNLLLGANKGDSRSVRRLLLASVENPQSEIAGSAVAGLCLMATRDLQDREQVLRFYKAAVLHLTVRGILASAYIEHYKLDSPTKLEILPTKEFLNHLGVLRDEALAADLVAIFQRVPDSDACAYGVNYLDPQDLRILQGLRTAVHAAKTSRAKTVILGCVGARLDTTALEIVDEVLKTTEDKCVRAFAVRMLNRYPDIRVLEIIGRTLRQWSDVETRSAVFDALLQNRAESARTFLVELLTREPDVKIKQGLLRALALRQGSAETAGIVSAIVWCLDDAQVNTRLAAVMALGQQELKGNTNALNRLEKLAASDPSEEVRAAARTVLERMREE